MVASADWAYTPLRPTFRADAKISARVVAKHRYYAASRIANTHPSEWQDAWTPGRYREIIRVPGRFGASRIGFPAYGLRGILLLGRS
jgi:hypothetical protein